MKIIQFHAENIKKLKVVDITPESNFVQITGKNGSGKSSVLDSIWWALAGGGAMAGQTDPIRHGEEKAIIKLNLGEVVVIRRFTKSGTTLAVETENGFRAASPQKMLDDLIGTLSFDPLEFSRMAPKTQVETLRRIADVQLDFDALAKEDKDDTEKRRDIGRDIKNIEGQIAGIAISDKAPLAPIDVSDLIKQLGNAETANAAIREDERRQKDRMRFLNEVDAQISQLEATLEAARNKRHQLIDEIQAFTPKPLEDTTSIKSRIADAGELNALHANVVKRGELNAKVALLQKQYDDMTAKLEARAALRVKAVQEAKMPISGLSFGDGEVLFNEIPFTQLSGAEQLRVSVAIAMAGNPKLRVIRIKDGSLLDEDGIQIVREMASEKDYQVWCESVDSSGKIGIVMEDGAVKASEE